MLSDIPVCLSVCLSVYMLFLQGSEVIFKVSLSLLGSHKPLILQHDSLESIVDFIKTTLPNLGLVQMEEDHQPGRRMDLSNQLQAYEVEYYVLQDELCDTPAHLNQSQRTAQLERTNQSLRQQNLDLLEELQARVCRLEGQVEGLAQSEALLREQVFDLEEERNGLRNAVTHLHTLLTALGIHTHTTHGDFNLDPHTHSAADTDGPRDGQRDGPRDGQSVDVPTREGPRLGQAMSSPLLPHPLALPEH
uniref:Uncharacterized protein n=1 Tax=Oncorhynchus kisutch TaxID=8019 RepID=A0A8C7JDA3_ONCKI